MSAYYVGFHHINAILSFVSAETTSATRPRFYAYAGAEAGGPIGYGAASDNELTILGRTLLIENVRSLNARYSVSNDMVGSEVPSAYVFERVNVSRLTAKDVIGALACLDYQSCESDDYMTTVAAQLIAKMKLWLYEQLVPRSDTWSIDEDKAPYLPKPRVGAPAGARTITRRRVSRRSISAA